MRLRICAVLFCSVLLSALVQAQSAAQALFQALHDHSYDHGQYEGTFTATPQQMIQRVDNNTLQQLLSSSSTLQRNPNDVNALVLRGYAALSASEKSMYRDSWLHFAAQDFERVLSLDPNNFIAHHDYAEICFEVGDQSPTHPVLRLAVYHYSRAIQLKPNSARSYMGRGWAYLAMSDAAHANADFQQALQLDPSLQPQLVSEANAIRQRQGQIANTQQMLRAMGSYTVDPTVHSASQCAAKKGYWYGNQCRFGDMGLHQGVSAPPMRGTGTYNAQAGGVFVR